MTIKSKTYTAKIVKNQINGKFDVFVAAIGGNDIWKHGTYGSMGRAQSAAKKAVA